MAKILKRKRLFEDDFQNAGQAAQQQPVQQPAQQQQPTQQQPVQQPQQAQPQQQQQQDQNQQQNQQQQQQQNQQQQQQQQQIQQKVGEMLKNLENAYWAIGNNVPEEIQKAIPEFKVDNEQAKPIIDLWNKFKEKPDQNSYNAFINAFKQFGIPQQQEQNQQQAVNAGYINDFDFKQALQENLRNYNREQAIIDSLSRYYDAE